MKALRLTTILALAACLSLLLCVAPLTDTAYATETSLEADDTHTFTHTLETYGDEQAHVYDFFNDKAFDYGSITKTFRLPDSYTVAIEPNEQSIISAVLQIVELSAENGVTINLNKAEDDYDWTYFSASIDVNGLERDLTFGYSANKFIEPPLNANYEGAHQYGFFRDYSIDDENDVYFSEYDRWLDTATISASDSFLITGKLSVHLADTEGIRHILVFNYDALEMKPIGDGSLIALDSYYSMESSSLSDTTPPGVNLDVRPVGRVFSTDTEESCYIVPSLLYDLPDENYSLTFIYNGTAGIAGSDYSLYISETPDEPYTIQARLDFSTVDGKEHTLFTNTITVRRHTVELRIDGTDDYRVGVNQAHDYSFVFDNNDVPDANVFAEWIFDRSGKYFDSDNVDELDAEDYSVVSDKRVVAESFTATGERLIALNLEITCNDGHENIGIYGKRFAVEVFEEEPQRRLPDYGITFNVADGSAALVGGTPFTVSASINEVFKDEHFVTELTVSGNAVGILSSQNNALTLMPVEAGRAVVFFSAISPTAGTFTKSLTVNVIESVPENTTIAFKDEFNLTGSDLTAYVTVGGYSSFLNAIPQWTVQIEDGEELKDVPFTVDNVGAATVDNAKKGFYHFSVSGGSITDTTAEKRVANVNMAEFAEKFMPLLAAIMIVAVVAALLIRQTVKRRRTVDLRISKVCDNLQKLSDSTTINNSRAVRKLKAVRRTIKRILVAVDLRDHQSLGMYSSVCNLLNTSIKVCDATVKSIDKLSHEKLARIVIFIKDEYLSVAARICAELDDAVMKFNATKVAAVTETPEEKQRQQKPDYLEMLTQFYMKGDIEDGNSREGDGDRDTDDETEN